MMPKKSPTPCAAAGCLSLAYNGPYCEYCEQHTRQKAKQYDKERGTAAQRGYDAKWRRYRIQYLAQHPYCVKCLKEGKFVFATVIDHIIPHKGDIKLFWDGNNHQALCKSCHDAKTVREDGGSFCFA